MRCPRSSRPADRCSRDPRGVRPPHRSLGAEHAARRSLGPGLAGSQRARGRRHGGLGPDSRGCDLDHPRGRRAPSWEPRRLRRRFPRWRQPVLDPCDLHPGRCDRGAAGGEPRTTPRVQDGHSRHHSLWLPTHACSLVVRSRQPPQPLRQGCVGGPTRSNVGRHPAVARPAHRCARHSARGGDRGALSTTFAVRLCWSHPSGGAQGSVVGGPSSLGDRQASPRFHPQRDPADSRRRHRARHVGRGAGWPWFPSTSC